MPGHENILESSLQIRDEARSEIEIKVGVLEYTILKEEKKTLWATKIISASHMNYLMCF